ncbi:DNA helicase/exodeoxyribonuclease V, beta subunit [Alkalispirochaeta americana]|uniref:RecBCD enzyme subunit RecB n=1 Tax=Alkalispirochaeta americana TaxID=159291 RepID=A0A1N6PCF9_9SPIO|nr:exodeoxyribonuclease V subunit beta [Alkalispirochaeta americana]SIQ01949.1 DNA helicase/exodeoxyribonuclease V, beta subunit [Alkalispirochaeta americana]
MKPEQLNPMTFPLKGSRLIEAGAGTGKTYTIAQLYTRLILGHGTGKTSFGRPLAPSEILVVTFTEAATMELRDRIRSRLVEAGQVFRRPHRESSLPQDPLLKELRDSIPPEEHPWAARLLEKAAEEMDQAAIFTIHSWCQRTLKENAFESGLSFHQEITPDPTDLWSQAVRDYWRATFYGLTTEEAAALEGIFLTPDALEDAMAPLKGIVSPTICFEGSPLGTPRHPRETLQSILETRRLHRQAGEDLQQYWRGQEEEILEDLRNIQEGLNQRNFKEARTPEEFQEALDECIRWAREGQPEDPPPFMKKLAPEKIKLKKGWSIPESSPLLTLGKALEELDQRNHQHFHHEAANLTVHALEETRRRYRRMKEQRSLLDFEDMVLHLARALDREREGSDRLATRIATQFPVALVDEFQDTDQAQYQIFDRIYRVAENCPDRGLFLIGDPKQAIYRFRGADIFTYLVARRATAGRHYALTTNYRSRKSMVQAVNRVFTTADTHRQGAFLFGSGDEGEIPFLPASARPDRSAEEEPIFLIDGTPVPALTIWTFKVGPDNSIMGTEAFRSTAARIGAEQIFRWLSQDDQGHPRGIIRENSLERPVRPSDLAVLVRSAKEALAIQEELRHRGISSVYLSERSSLFQTHEAEDLLIWLRALASPGEETRIREALATSSMAIPLEELERSAREDLLRQNDTDRFIACGELWQQEGILPAIRRLLQEYGVAARHRDSPGGERVITNLLHGAEWLHQMSATVHTRQELIRLLAQRIQNPGNEQVLRLESDQECLRIVTIFKAKGLEYNLVIAPFLSLPHTPGPRRKHLLTPLVWHDENHTALVELSGDYPKAQEAHAREVLSEEMRLLYVTLTRSRIAAFTALAPVSSGNRKSPANHATGAGYLISGEDEPENAQAMMEGITSLAKSPGEIELVVLPPEADPPEEESRLHLPARGEGPAREPRRAHRKAGTPWWIASYSALHITSAEDLPREPEVAAQALAQEEPHLASPRNAPVAAPGTPAFHAFPAGARAGTLLHEALEEAGKAGFSRCRDELPQELLETLQEKCLLRGWEEWTPALTDWTRKIVTVTLPLPGNPSLADITVYQAELEFLFPARRLTTEQLDREIQRRFLPDRERPPLAPRLLSGMMKGFIDLIFFHQGKYYLADWKSNRLGEANRDYSRDALEEELCTKRYDVQMALYNLALHRHLKQRLPGYRCEDHLGGAIYLFLRGLEGEPRGALFYPPDLALLKELDQLFQGQQKEIPREGHPIDA